LIFFKEEALR